MRGGKTTNNPNDEELTKIYQKSIRTTQERMGSWRPRSPTERQDQIDTYILRAKYDIQQALIERSVKMREATHIADQFVNEKTMPASRGSSAYSSPRLSPRRQWTRPSTPSPNQSSPRISRRLSSSTRPNTPPSSQQGGKSSAPNYSSNYTKKPSIHPSKTPTAAERAKSKSKN